MSKAGTFQIQVEHARNTETITVSSTGMVGGIPVNTVRNKTTYPSRTPNTTSQIYWAGILARASTQLG